MAGATAVAAAGPGALGLAAMGLYNFATQFFNCLPLQMLPTC